MWLVYYLRMGVILIIERIEDIIIHWNTCYIDIACRCSNAESFYLSDKEFSKCFDRRSWKKWKHFCHERMNYRLRQDSCKRRCKVKAIRSRVWYLRKIYRNTLITSTLSFIDFYAYLTYTCHLNVCRINSMEFINADYSQKTVYSAVTWQQKNTSQVLRQRFTSKRSLPWSFFTLLLFFSFLRFPIWIFDSFHLNIQIICQLSGTFFSYLPRGIILQLYVAQIVVSNILTSPTAMSARSVIIFFAIFSI